MKCAPRHDFSAWAENKNRILLYVKTPDPSLDYFGMAPLLAFDSRNWGCKPDIESNNPTHGGHKMDSTITKPVWRSDGIIQATYSLFLGGIPTLWSRMGPKWRAQFRSDRRIF
uniref:Uncharacterized protein n=1 Tax=Trieres chinensis TaxID=1514140 RepID=A0A6U1ZXH3_TRICV|mmetsp:Transcript_9826/g.20777  ORF Transcript_9826/g.20777 Transcript_9826/m.20777 type:complete len:113 (+) Transcript_9826:132-470(+)